MTAIGRPGLQKLNIVQNSANKTATASSSALKTTAAKGLATAQRATGGVSYGILAQRSAAGTGAIFNPKQYNSDSIGLQRMQLNANRVRVNNNFTPIASHQCNSSDNKFATALMAMQMLNKTLESAIPKSKSDGAGSTTKSTGDSILSQIRNAKTSGDVEKALNDVKSKLQTIETETPKLEKEVKEAKEANDKAKTNLQDTNKNIETEKQKIQEYDGTITRLSSQISGITAKINVLNLELNSLDKNIANSPRIQELRTQITDFEKQKTNLEQEKKKAEDSKTASETKLKNELQPAKEKYTKEVTDTGNTAKEAQAKLDKMTAQKEKLDTAKGEAEKKLQTQNQKDMSKLNSMKKKLDDYKAEFQKETKADKKSKISEKYTTLAKEFNSMLGDMSADVSANYRDYETDLGA